MTRWMLGWVLLAVTGCTKSNESKSKSESEPKPAPAVAPVDAVAAAPPDAAPPRPEVLGDVIDLAAGVDFACAVLADGRIACWGSDRLGALGDGDAGPSRRPVLVQGIDDAIAITADGDFACALRADGRAACWGKGGYGNLGAADTPDRCTTTMGVEVPCARAPVEITGLSRAVAIDANDMRVCALDGDGRVWCWGRGIVGAPMPDTCTAGRNTEPCARTPVAIPGIGDAVEIGLAMQATCYRTRKGRVRCWGQHWNGELGDGKPKQREASRPVDVVGLDDVAQLSASTFGFCARRAGGEVHCWGDVEGLGDGSPPPAEREGHVRGRPRPGPVLVDVAARTALSGATDLHDDGATCAARGDDGLWCWGSLPSQQLPAGILANTCPDGSCKGLGAVKVGDATVRRYLTSSLVGPCALLASGQVTCRDGPVPSPL